MSKVKTANHSKIWLIIIVLLLVALFVTGGIIILTNNRYVGTYNYDNRYTITLKQDNTCDFAERGESGYSNNALECTYEIKDGVVNFDRDVISYRFEKDGSIERGQGVGSNFTCEKYRGKGLIEYCKEEVVRIQETAAIGETGMVYKDQTYTKLK